MRILRVYGRAAMWAAKLIATVALIPAAFGLINTPSTVLPFLGVLLLGAVGLAWAVWFVDHVAPAIAALLHRTRLLPLAALALLSLVGCTRVDPGYVGIQVYYYGSFRGEPIERGAGTIWYLPFYSTVLEYPVFQRQTAWTHKVNEGRQGIDDSLTYNSKEGMVFHADVSIAYTLKPHCVANFYRRFRTDDLDTFTHGFLRQSAQNAANGLGSKYTAEELYGDKKNEFMDKVVRALNDEFSPLCVEVVQMGYTEAPRPPAPIVDAINNKIKATQDAITTENQLRQSTAQAQKAVAEATGRAKSVLVEAEAQAQANLKLSASLTPQLLQAQWIKAWDGHQPQVLAGQQGGGLLINLPAPAATKTP